MVIVPSVDVRSGRVAYRGVTLASLTERGPLPPGSSLDAAELAMRYVRDGAEELHLVDLDGAERGELANFGLLSNIARNARVPCRLAGGIASLDQAKRARDAGFAGVLFSSAVFGDRNLLHRCARTSGAIVEIESKDGRLAPRGGDPALVAAASGMLSREAASIAALRGAKDLYVIDLSTEGRLGGPPLVLLEELRTAARDGVRFHTGGGVRSLDDIRALASWGTSSVVVGRAFLDGLFTLAEAKAACA